MIGTHASRRSRLGLLALLAVVPLIAATLPAVIHPAPASAATRAQVLHLMDANGASVVDRSDHGGDHRSDHGDSSDRHGDRSDSHHDEGDRHHDEGDRHHDEGDNHRGAECHNCGIDNGDHRSDEHNGDRDHNGEGHGEKGGCGPRRESLLEALLDGLCTGAEELERALVGAR